MDNLFFTARSLLWFFWGGGKKNTMEMFILIPEKVSSRSGGDAEGEFRSGEIMSPEGCPDWILGGMAESR